MSARAPYGTWPSPLTARTLAAGSLRLSAVAIDRDDVYWLEGRPDEGGRIVLMRSGEDRAVHEVTPAGTNVRTRVHEYGGGAYIVRDGVVYFCNYADQRIYRVQQGLPAEPVTPSGDWFYADMTLDPARRRLVAVREDHTRADAEPVNALVSIPLGDTASVPVVIASGYDFYSTPRFSPDGRRLSWLAWRHPHMPWDATELWVADVATDGTIGAAACVAGGNDESIFQPGWSPDGTLYFVSDRTGWWNLYRLQDGRSEALHTMAADCGRPQWQFGMATWAFSDQHQIVVTYSDRGRWHVATIDTTTRNFAREPTELEPGENIVAMPGSAVFVGATARAAAAVVRLDLRTGESEVLRSSSRVTIDPAFLSVAEAIEFPADEGSTAHAFYYPPTNPSARAGEDERPPLIVISHGGPTVAATATLDLGIQYWTSRGFAIVDVNYRGSTGYGRAYRTSLNGQWGLMDVSDCVQAARYLVAQGKADGQRLIIRGGSAGGYTTLAALTWHPEVFSAGASYYGISDIEVLARDTHKFESRYLDSMIGPYPAARDVYYARSPIHFVDRLACPLILFQGLEDKVVPPNQAEMMAEAVRKRGLPVALLLFEGEQHGFRRAATLVRCLEAELHFYGAVFGFTPADRLDPIAIDNLPDRPRSA